MDDGKVSSPCGVEDGGLVAGEWPLVHLTGSCSGRVPVSLVGFLVGSHGDWPLLGGD